MALVLSAVVLPTAAQARSRAHATVTRPHTSKHRHSNPVGGSGLNLGGIAIYGAMSAGAQGSAYSATLYATGGWGNYSWSIASGSLPPGLALSSGTISGSPSKAGWYSFEVKVTDAVGGTAVADFGIGIGGPPSTTPLPPNGPYAPIGA